MGDEDKKVMEGPSPELLAFEQRRVERQLMDSFPGKILADLRTIAEAEGVTEVGIEEGTFGRFKYTYNGEEALLQIHVNAGMAHYHTPLLDMQKAWWRKAFVDEALEGDESMFSYIAPSLTELLEKYADQASITAFGHASLANDAGLKLDKLGEEYTENDVYGVHDNDDKMAFIDGIGDFLTDFLSPDFVVHFDDGNGDLYRKIRLKPLNDSALNILKEGGNALEGIINRIVHSRKKLVESLRAKK